MTEEQSILMIERYCERNTAMEREKIRVTLYKLYRGTEISYALSPCRAKVFDKCMATAPDGCNLIYSDCDGLCVTLPDYSHKKITHRFEWGICF